jgi:sugar-phosphatase
LPVPKVLVTADDVANGKPHPEPYLKGAARLGFEPTDCLVIEDAPAGIRSARTGGMKVVGITSTYAASKLVEVDALVTGLAQIQVGRDGTSKLNVSVVSSKADSSLVSPR